MKKFYLMLVAMFVALAAQAWTVSFTNPDNWAKPYIWAWAGGTNFTGGTWPGMPMTQNGDVWTFTGEGAGTPEYVIFSNNGSPQTGNLPYVDGATYDKNGAIGAQTYEYTVYFENANNWANVYVYGYGNFMDSQNSTWPGQKLSAGDDGLYVWTFTSTSTTPPSSLGDDFFVFNNGESGDAEQKTIDITDYQLGATYLPSGEIKGQEQGDTDYTGWWFNLMGPYNGWSSDAAGTQVTADNLVASWTDQAIGTEGFKLKTWNGVKDTYYIATTPEIAVGDWAQLVVDNSDAAPIMIQGATASSVYNVQYDVENKLIMVELVGGEEPTPDPVYTEFNRFAYGLEAEKSGENTYTISFYATGDAASANLVLTNVETGDVETVDMGVVTAGLNTYILDASEYYDTDKYNWAVDIVNFPVQETVVSSVTNVGVNRGALATFTDPEYPESYGYMVVAHTKNGGIDVFNPEGTQVGTLLHVNCEAMGGTGANNSCPMDATTNGNKVYFASWGDAANGVVAFDVTNTDAAPFGVFGGVNTGDGTMVIDGVKTGSGTPGVAVWGSDEETTIVTFDEDIFNNALAYNVIGNAEITENPLELLNGEETIWGTRPGYWGQSNAGPLANTNVGIAAIKDGIFVSQIRGTAMEAQSSGLRYISMPEGKNIWCANDVVETQPDLLPSSVAGVDVNRAETV